jgi:hypothetical protein
MAKSSGIGWTTASVDDSAGTPQAIKNDITDVDFATPRAVQDVTGIDKSAMERLLLLADFSITLKGVFNPAAGATSHTVFKTVPSTSVNRTTTLVVNAVTMANEVVYTDYKIQRGKNGELTWECPGLLADGATPGWT